VPKKPEKVFILRNQANLASAMTAISKIKPGKDKVYTLKISLGDESRSNKQNRLSFLWYGLKGTLTGHGMEYERQVCKLQYGVPILRRDSKEFNDFYTTAFLCLTYEQKLVSMEFIPVTSLMSVRQFAEYLTTIDNESANAGQVLPHPEDLYWDAIMMEQPQ